jgi:hypothetical protein
LFSDKKERLCIQTKKFLVRNRPSISPHDLKRYFETVDSQINSIPSPFLWNADEMRVACPKTTSPPEVIVGDWTSPYFIWKLKPFDRTLLTAQQLYEGHDYTIRSTPGTLITEVLFIDWLETIFVPRIAELRQKFAYDGPSILIVDGHSTHVTARVIALCGARKIILIRLVLHSSHLAQPFDLCVFGLLKIIYRKEKQSGGMKGETRKICRALLARERLEVPELPFDDALVYPERLDHQQVDGSQERGRHRIPGPAEFAISLIA